MNDRGVKSDKQIMSEKILKLAAQCKSLDELERKLQDSNIKTYRRGKVFKGVHLPNGQKRRLTTLGVSKDQLQVLTLEQKRLEQLRKLKERKNYDRERDRG